MKLSFPLPAGCCVSTGNKPCIWMQMIGPDREGKNTLFETQIKCNLKLYAPKTTWNTMPCQEPSALFLVNTSSSPVHRNPDSKVQQSPFNTREKITSVEEHVEPQDEESCFKSKTLFSAEWLGCFASSVLTAFETRFFIWRIISNKYISATRSAFNIQ